VTSIVEGEYAENAIRKDFTESERVAIGTSIEGLVEERRGKYPRGNTEKANMEPVPSMLESQTTRDFVAQRVGFGSGRSYDQAKAVVSRGTSDLVDAMDAKQVSIKDAEAISRLPQHEQRAEMTSTMIAPKYPYRIRGNSTMMTPA